MTLLRARARLRYMLEGELLRPGDILLSTQEAKASLAIRLFTRSRFSHAAIVLGDGMYAEAVGLGVRIRSIRTILAPRLLVRRLASGDTTAAQRAADLARKYVHAGYWTSGAMLAMFRAARLDDRNLLFCSHLVARCYEEAGAAIVERTAPDKTTPASLARSDRLVDVADAVFVPKFVPGYLYAGRFETLSDRETTAVQSAYADLLSWFDAQGLSAPKSWIDMLVALAELNHPLLQRSLDEAMQAALIRHGYFKLARQALQECILPLEKELDDVPNKSVPVEHAQNDYYFFQEGYATFTRQLATDRDNEAFFTEQFERTRLATFDLLALDAKAHGATTQRMIELCLAMMHALHDKYRMGDKRATLPSG